MESEARVRLVAGLKKYYHAKQREGLLSGRGTQILDWACSIAMDEPDRPLHIWQIVHRCSVLPRLVLLSACFLISMPSPLLVLHHDHSASCKPCCQLAVRLKS